jgi:hypothetical protein
VAAAEGRCISRRVKYNQVRPHGVLGSKPPAPESRTGTNTGGDHCWQHHPYGRPGCTNSGGMVSLRMLSWNRIAEWIREINVLRKAQGVTASSQLLSRYESCVGGYLSHSVYSAFLS